jgi:hypothetical protein
MNVNVVGSAAEEADRNLQSWEEFVNAYCAESNSSYREVMEDPVLVELLNIRWLRTRSRRSWKRQSNRTG